MAVTTVEEPPILSRLDRLNNITRQLEDIRSVSRTPKSSCASTPSSGTVTSDGQVSWTDFSPRSLEKHCRPIEDVIVETGTKGTVIERLVDVEYRVANLDEDMKVEKRRVEEEEENVGKKKKKKGLKQLVKSCVTSKQYNNK